MANRPVLYARRTHGTSTETLVHDILAYMESSVDFDSWSNRRCADEAVRLTLDALKADVQLCMDLNVIPQTVTIAVLDPPLTPQSTSTAVSVGTNG